MWEAAQDKLLAWGELCGVNCRLAVNCLGLSFPEREDTHQQAQPNVHAGLWARPYPQWDSVCFPLKAGCSLRSWQPSPA